jgi:hypothetical protein
MVAVYNKLCAAGTRPRTQASVAAIIKAAEDVVSRVHRVAAGAGQQDGAGAAPPGVEFPWLDEYEEARDRRFCGLPFKDALRLTDAWQVTRRLDEEASLLKREVYQLYASYQHSARVVAARRAALDTALTLHLTGAVAAGDAVAAPGDAQVQLAGAALHLVIGARGTARGGGVGEATSGGGGNGGGGGSGGGGSGTGGGGSGGGGSGGGGSGGTSTTTIGRCGADGYRLARVTVSTAPGVLALLAEAEVSHLRNAARVKTLAGTGSLLADGEGLANLRADIMQASGIHQSGAAAAAAAVAAAAQVAGAAPVGATMAATVMPLAAATAAMPLDSFVSSCLGPCLVACNQEAGSNAGW